MKALGIALGACALAISSVWADGHDEGEGMRFVPVETYTCSYHDGKGPEDLAKASAFWNKWADKQGFDQYFAATVTPVYHGDDTFDVGWIGAWTSGEAMGGNMDSWMSNGGEAAARFAEVVDCETHSNFATTQMKAPAEDGPDNFYLTFSDCKVGDDPDWNQIMEGAGAWGEYMTEKGYNNGMWMMFPVYGGGKEDYAYKAVESWDSFADLGRAYDMYGTGGDWAKHAELMGGGVMCDSARVYAATVVRRPAEAE